MSSGDAPMADEVHHDLECGYTVEWHAPLNGAAEVHNETALSTERDKPRLFVEECNPDRTVEGLRDILASAGVLYDRGVPVRLASDQTQRGIVAQAMTPDALVLMAHRVCRPFKMDKTGHE